MDGLVQETIELARKEKTWAIRAYVCSADKDKLSVLEEAGLKQEAALRGYCFSDGKYSDMRILRLGKRGA